MKNKVRLIVSISILIIALAVGVFFLITNKSKADTIGKTSSPSLLSGLSVNEQKSEMPTIKLPAKYSSEEITKALADANLKTRSVSTSSTEILAFIDKQTKELVAQTNTKIKADQAKTPNASKIGFADLVIDVRDSNDQPLIISQSASQTRSLSVVDNFNFDASVTPDERTFFTEAYTKIENFIGPRDNEQKIFVTHDSTYDTGTVIAAYYPSLNTIRFSMRDDGMSELNKEVIAHELTHAFYGKHRLSDFWEEAIASTVPKMTGLIVTGQFDVYDSYYLYNYFRSAVDSGDYMSGYQYGSWVISRILLEDRTFLVKFNREIFQLTNSQSENMSSPGLIEMIGKIVPKVENKPIYNWFAEQYAFVPSDFNYDMYQPNFILNGLSIKKSVEDDELTVQLGFSAKSVNIKIFDYNDKIIGECNNNNTDFGVEIYDKCRPKISPSYSGYIKAIVVPDGNNDLAQTFYFPNPSLYSYGIEGFVVGYPGATIVTMTNLDSGKVNATEIKNGYFNFNCAGSICPYNADLRKSGRYKLEIKNGGSVLTTRYFNKVSTNLVMPVYNLPNNCNIMALSAIGVPGGISVTATINKFCASIVSLNGVPVVRAYSQNYKQVINGMIPKTTYNLTFATADDYSTSSVKSLAVTPLDYFTIVKEENIGTPSKGDFRRRVTFNYPIKVDSFDSGFFDDGKYAATASILKVDNLTYDFVPDGVLLDNHEYMLTYMLGKTSDGFLLNNQSMNSSSFTTPISIVSTVPKVTTLIPISVTANAVLPHGNITDTGGLTVTKRGFKLTRIKGTPQADYADTGSFGAGEFTKTNISLYFPNTTYYIQAYATNSKGTTYGDWVEFKTLAPAAVPTVPKVTTLPITSVTANGVLPHGNITDAGGLTVTKRGFQITRVKGTPQADYPDTGSFGVGEFTKTNISLYFANTIYYVRAYATNSKGTTYGDWVEFKTLSKQLELTQIEIEKALVQGSFLV